MSIAYAEFQRLRPLVLPLMISTALWSCGSTTKCEVECPAGTTTAASGCACVSTSDGGNGVRDAGLSCPPDAGAE